jgi:hypothetical protein
LDENARSISERSCANLHDFAADVGSADDDSDRVANSAVFFAQKQIVFKKVKTSREKK